MQDYSFELGRFACTVISDGGLNYPVETFFKGIPLEEAAALLQAHGLPTNHIYTPYAVLYVETEAHRILIDTGLGSFGRLAPRIFPHVDNSNTRPGSFLENFIRAGHRPEDVDIVILTHAHPDHVGGNIDEEGRVVFPNARFIVSREEWDFWHSDERTAHMRPPQNVTIARACLDPIEKQATMIDGEVEIAPGIRTIAVPGHTPGQFSVLLESGGQNLLNITDTILHPLHLIYPALSVVFDDDYHQAVASKRAIADRAAETGALVFAHHLPPFPNLGHIVRDRDAWTWQPLARPAG